jgi:hypothetical protein
MTPVPKQPVRGFTHGKGRPAVEDQGIAGLVIAFILGQAALWADGRRQAKIRAVEQDARATATDEKIDLVSANADTASQNAELAAERSKPTSNGFAEEMRDFAADTREGMSTLVAGQTAQATELREIRRDLARHLGDHASRDLLGRAP